MLYAIIIVEINPSVSKFDGIKNSIPSCHLWNPKNITDWFRWFWARNPASVYINVSGTRAPQFPAQKDFPALIVTYVTQYAIPPGYVLWVMYEVYLLMEILGSEKRVLPCFKEFKIT